MLLRKKKLLKFYDSVLKYLFSKNVKNRYFVAIFVNIVFLFFANSHQMFMFPQFQWPNIQ